MKFKLICNDTPYFLFEDSVSYRIPKYLFLTLTNLVTCGPDDWICVNYRNGVCRINNIECNSIQFRYFINPPMSEIETQNLSWFGCFFDKYFEVTRKKMNFREYVELNEIVNKNIKIETPWYEQQRGMKTTYIHIQGINAVVDTNKTKNGYHNFKVEFWLTQQTVVQPPVYSFKFYFDHPTSGYITKQTSANQVEATTLFPVVQNVFQKFIDLVDTDSIIHFISDVTELSRIRLYDRLVSKLPTTFYKFDNEDMFPKEDDCKHYAFTKSKYVFDCINDGSCVNTRKSLPQP